MNGSEVLVTFKGDTKDLDNATKEAKKNTKDFADMLVPGLKTAAGIAAGAIAGATAAVVGLSKSAWNGAKEMAQYGDEIDKNSQKVGFSKEAYQQWDYVMKIAGTSMNDCTVGMKTLAKQADDAAKGGKNSSEAFKKLGIDTKQLATMSREDIFATVVSGLNKMEDSAERASLASQLLGKSGQNLTPLFNMTDEEIKNLIQDTETYGMVMSDDAVSASAQFQDSMTKLQSTGKGLKNKFFGVMLPGFSSIIDGFSDMVGGIEGGDQKIEKGIENIADSFSKMLPSIVETMTKMLPTLIQAAGKIIVAIIQGIAQALPQIVPAIIQVVQQISNTLISMLPQLLEMGMQLLFEIIMGIAQALPEMIPTIIDIVLTMVGTLLENIDLLIDCALQLIIGLTEGLINALPILVEKTPEIVWKLTLGIIKSVPKILKAAVELIDTLLRGLINNFFKIVDWVMGIPGRIKDAILKGVEKLKEVGGQCMEGLVNGLKEKWNKLKESVSNLGKGIVDKFKGVFGIASPSKVMKKQIGVNIGLGIVKGLEQTEKDLNKQVGTLSNDMLTGLSVSAGDINTGLSPQLIGTANTHYSPQINVIVNNDLEIDPLGQVVSKIKTFSGGSKNDYNYGMGGSRLA